MVPEDVLSDLTFEFADEPLDMPIAKRQELAITVANSTRKNLPHFVVGVGLFVHQFSKCVSQLPRYLVPDSIAMQGITEDHGFADSVRFQSREHPIDFGDVPLLRYSINAPHVTAKSSAELIDPHR